MLEIACFNPSSAVTAAKAGADRIELCADYSAGGVTPSLASLMDIRKEITIPINVMIRPRSGKFIYSEKEFEAMKEDILMFKSQASGFVFGILDQDGQIDISRNHELVELAAPHPCTFHRAFDQVPDMMEAAKQLTECGFKYILTSGGQSNAIAGSDSIVELQKQYGGRIRIILGGGIRAQNAGELKRKTKVDWIHSAAITQAGEQVDEEEVARLKAAVDEITA